MIGLKLFIDTANVEEIKKAKDLGILDGVTTNPTLIAKEKRKFRDLIAEIASITDTPISVEVIATDAKGMIMEARELTKIASNFVIKIPMSEEGLKAVKVLSGEEIKTNMTLIFSANQALLAAKAGATYVSPFIGRLDDASHEGMQIVRDTMQIFRNYDFKTQLIVASVRHPLHIIEAAEIGAHIVTAPPEVIWKMIKHPLTDIGLQRFLEDWKKAEPFL